MPSRARQDKLPSRKSKRNRSSEGETESVSSRYSRRSQDRKRNKRSQSRNSRQQNIKSPSKKGRSRSRTSCLRIPPSEDTNEEGLVLDQASVSPEFNWITSYGSQYIREWLRENDGYYGEIHGKNKCLLKYEGKVIPEFDNVSLSVFETELRRLKPTNICIVKCFVAVSDYYASHWYFQSPYNPNDFHRKHGKPKTLNNSYALDWQISKTDQFCMLYAFYGATRPKSYWDQHCKDPFFDFEQVPNHEDNSSLDVAGKWYHSLSQNQNTKKLMKFFLDHITSEEAKDSNVVSVANKKRRDASSVKFSIKDLKDKLQEGVDHPGLFKPYWK